MLVKHLKLWRMDFQWRRHLVICFSIIRPVRSEHCAWDRKDFGWDARCVCVCVGVEDNMEMRERKGACQVTVVSVCYQAVFLHILSLCPASVPPSHHFSPGRHMTLLVMENLYHCNVIAQVSGSNKVHTVHKIQGSFLSFRRGGLGFLISLLQFIFLKTCITCFI